MLYRRSSGRVKADNKPKSFLEIQQEQAVDVHKQDTTTVLTASLAGKAPQKPKVLYCTVLYTVPTFYYASEHSQHILCKKYESFLVTYMIG